MVCLGRDQKNAARLIRVVKIEEYASLVWQRCGVVLEEDFRHLNKSIFLQTWKVRSDDV